MEKSKVYFVDFRTKEGNHQLNKLKTLCKKAGIEKIDFKDKYVAVKMHLGEPGNLAFLRPNYATAVCDLIKELGGKPFLTDCNTLYVGGRSNGLDHLTSAYANGFSPLTTGVHTIIADGIRGRDERILPIPNGELLQEARIGSALADADIIVSLTHFKGHISAGFGGALKNIGMGGGSRAGKLAMHNEGSPDVIEELCIGCGTCVRNCANNGIKVVDGKAKIQPECVGCGYCMTVCPKEAISTLWSQAKDKLSKKISEYAWAILNDKPAFHISLVMDVSPNCDCEPFNDTPIVPNIGMFASFDPVALDQACYDAVLKQPAFQNSYLGKKCSEGHDHDFGGDYFRIIHPATDGVVQLEHGEKLGMGSRDYELIEL